MTNPSRDVEPTSYLRLSEASFSYPGNQVLAGVSLTVHGGVTGLLGVNGAGKTTMLRMMATLASPDRGSVEILGEAPDRPEAKKRIRSRLGYLPQNAGWTPSVTAGDFLRYFAWQRGVSAKSRTEAVDKAAQRTNTVGLLSRRLGDLSGGEHQRVMLAQTILNEPDLLILDEPTVGLDPEQRHSFREVIRGLADNACVLLSTHLLEDIRHLAGQVVILHGGHIAFQDTPSALAARAWEMDSQDALQQGFLRIIQEEPAER